MWVQPADAGNHSWILWDTLKQNKYFTMFAHRTRSFNSDKEDSYLVVTNFGNLLVATAPSQAKAEEKWAWLEQTLIPVLTQMDGLTRRESEEFIVKKIQSLLIHEDEDPVSRATTKKFDDVPVLAGEEKKNYDLMKSFNLPTETLISSYAVTIWRKIPFAGTAYVTRNYVIFSSPMLNKIVTIPFTEVLQISKVDSPGLSVGAVRLKTGASDYSFACLFHRDELYTILDQLWKRTMENMGMSANFVKNQTDRLRYNDEGPLPLEAHLAKDGGLHAVLSKEELKDRTRNEMYCSVFQLPNTEVLIGEYPILRLIFFPLVDHKTGEGKIGVTANNGHLFLSSSFLCFHSSSLTLDNGLSMVQGDYLVFIIPLKELKKAKKTKVSIVEQGGELFPDEEFKDVIFFTTQSAFRIALPQVKIFYDTIIQLSKTLRAEYPDYHNVPRTLADLKERHPFRFDMAALDDRTQFSENYQEREMQQGARFMEYFEKLGNSICIGRSPRLSALVETGIPLWMKSSMWQLISGSFAFQMTNKVSYYPSLVAEAKTKWSNLHVVAQGGIIRDEQLLVLDQIERDLHRSLPSQSYYAARPGVENPMAEDYVDSEGIQALRRVLHAYAMHNPMIGYCQSMNIVVASLLMFADEEEAFYLLCAIVRKVPEYYESNMIGVIADSNLFAEILQSRLPDLHAHLKRISVDVSLITLPWFLTFFIGYVPWEASFRILDCFFAGGPNILLQVALAVLKMHEKRLLLFNDVVGFSEYMKNATFEVEPLCATAFVEYHLDPEEVNQMRLTYKFKAIQELQKRNKSAMFHDLRRSTPFALSELRAFYEDFQRSLLVDSTNQCIELDQFKSLFLIHVPWWPITEAMGWTAVKWKLLFNIFDAKGDKCLSFGQYARGLARVLRSQLPEQEKLVFEIFSTNQRLYHLDFPLAIRLVTRLLDNGEDAADRSAVLQFDCDLDELWETVKAIEVSPSATTTPSPSEPNTPNRSLANSAKAQGAPSPADPLKESVCLSASFALSSSSSEQLFREPSPSLAGSKKTLSTSHEKEGLLGADQNAGTNTNSSSSTNDGTSLSGTDSVSSLTPVKSPSQRDRPKLFMHNYINREQFIIACSLLIAQRNEQAYEAVNKQNELLLGGGSQQSEKSSNSSPSNSSNHTPLAPLFNRNSEYSKSGQLEREMEEVTLSSSGAFNVQSWRLLEDYQHNDNDKPEQADAESASLLGPAKEGGSNIISLF